MACHSCGCSGDYNCAGCSGYSTAEASDCCNCGNALISRCRMVAADIAALTRRINELEDYLEAYPDDRLAQCMVCEARRKLAAREAEYRANCTGCSTNCGAVDGSSCGCGCGCGCGDISPAGCGCGCGAEN